MTQINTEDTKLTQEALSSLSTYDWRIDPYDYYKSAKEVFLSYSIFETLIRNINDPDEDEEEEKRKNSKNLSRNISDLINTNLKHKNRLPIRILETVILENGQIIGWFYYDKKAGYVRRKTSKKFDSEHLLKYFLGQMKNYEFNGVKIFKRIPEEKILADLPMYAPYILEKVGKRDIKIFKKKKIDYIYEVEKVKFILIYYYSKEEPEYVNFVDFYFLLNEHGGLGNIKMIQNCIKCRSLNKSFNKEDFGLSEDNIKLVTVKFSKPDELKPKKFSIFYNKPKMLNPSNLFLMSSNNKKNNDKKDYIWSINNNNNTNNNNNGFSSSFKYNKKESNNNLPIDTINTSNNILSINRPLNSVDFLNNNNNFNLNLANPILNSISSNNRINPILNLNLNTNQTNPNLSKKTSPTISYKDTPLKKIPTNVLNPLGGPNKQQQNPQDSFDEEQQKPKFKFYLKNGEKNDGKILNHMEKIEDNLILQNNDILNTVLADPSEKLIKFIEYKKNLIIIYAYFIFVRIKQSKSEEDYYVFQKAHLIYAIDKKDESFLVKTYSLKQNMKNIIYKRIPEDVSNYKYFEKFTKDDFCYGEFCNYIVPNYFRGIKEQNNNLMNNLKIPKENKTSIRDKNNELPCKLPLFEIKKVYDNEELANLVLKAYSIFPPEFNKESTIEKIIKKRSNQQENSDPNGDIKNNNINEKHKENESEGKVCSGQNITEEFGPILDSPEKIKEKIDEYEKESKQEVVVYTPTRGKFLHVDFNDMYTEKGVCEKCYIVYTIILDFIKNIDECTKEFKDLTKAKNYLIRGENLKTNNFEDKNSIDNNLIIQEELGKMSVKKFLGIKILKIKLEELNRIRKRQRVRIERNLVTHKQELNKTFNYNIKVNLKLLLANLLAEKTNNQFFGMLFNELYNEDDSVFKHLDIKKPKVIIEKTNMKDLRLQMGLSSQTPGKVLWKGGVPQKNKKKKRTGGDNGGDRKKNNLLFKNIQKQMSQVDKNIFLEYKILYGPESDENDDEEEKEINNIENLDFNNSKRNISPRNINENNNYNNNNNNNNNKMKIGTNSPNKKDKKINSQFYTIIERFSSFNDNNNTETKRVNSCKKAENIQFEKEIINPISELLSEKEVENISEHFLNKNPKIKNCSESQISEDNYDIITPKSFHRNPEPNINNIPFQRNMNRKMFYTIRSDKNLSLKSLILNCQKKKQLLTNNNKKYNLRKDRKSIFQSIEKKKKKFGLTPLKSFEEIKRQKDKQFEEFMGFNKDKSLSSHHNSSDYLLFNDESRTHVRKMSEDSDRAKWPKDKVILSSLFYGKTSDEFKENNRKQPYYYVSTPFPKMQEVNSNLIIEENPLEQVREITAEEYGYLGNFFDEDDKSDNSDTNNRDKENENDDNNNDNIYEEDKEESSNTQSNNNNKNSRKNNNNTFIGSNNKKNEESDECDNKSSEDKDKPKNLLQSKNVQIYVDDKSTAVPYEVLDFDASEEFINKYLNKSKKEKKNNQIKNNNNDNIYEENDDDNNEKEENKKYIIFVINDFYDCYIKYKNYFQSILSKIYYYNRMSNNLQNKNKNTNTFNNSKIKNIIIKDDSLDINSEHMKTNPYNNNTSTENKIRVTKETTNPTRDINNGIQLLNKESQRNSPRKSLSIYSVKEEKKSASDASNYSGENNRNYNNKNNIDNDDNFKSNKGHKNNLKLNNNNNNKKKPDNDNYNEEEDDNNNKISRLKFVLFNLPGQSTTLFSKSTIQNNLFYSEFLDRFIFFLFKKKVFDPSYKIILLGFGNGGHIALTYTSLYEKYWNILESVIMFNSYCENCSLINEAMLDILRAVYKMNSPKMIHNFIKQNIHNPTEIYLNEENKNNKIDGNKNLNTSSRKFNFRNSNRNKNLNMNYNNNNNNLTRSNNIYERHYSNTRFNNKRNSNNNNFYSYKSNKMNNYSNEFNTTNYNNNNNKFGFKNFFGTEANYEYENEKDEESYITLEGYKIITKGYFYNIKINVDKISTKILCLHSNSDSFININGILPLFGHQISSYHKTPLTEIFTLPSPSIETLKTNNKNPIINEKNINNNNMYKIEINDKNKYDEIVDPIEEIKKNEEYIKDIIYKNSFSSSYSTSNNKKDINKNRKTYRSKDVINCLDKNDFRKSFNYNFITNNNDSNYNNSNNICNSNNNRFNSQKKKKIVVNKKKNSIMGYDLSEFYEKKNFSRKLIIFDGSHDVTHLTSEDNNIIYQALVSYFAPTLFNKE